MSDTARRSTTPDSASPSRRGQSLVEFALLLPMLIVLLLGIGDFGRAFASGITAEAAARDAAEAVAQEYLRVGPGNPPSPLNEPAPSAAEPDYNGTTYYRELHDLAARTACRELRWLPNTTYTPDNPSTPVDEETCRSSDEASRPSMPVIMTCVHDGVDPYCGNTAYGAPVHSSCTAMLTPPTPAQSGTAIGEDSRYVEVRVCYRFTTLVNLQDLQLPLGWGLSVGDIWLQRSNTFTVGYYPPPTPAPPPPQPPPPPPEPCSAPSASFSATPTSGPSPLSVEFTDTSTDVDCPIISRSWDFGDGTPASTEQAPVHTYTYDAATPTAQYTVTLTVSSGAGPSQATQIITVGSSAPCSAPIAGLEATPGGGPSPLDVQLTDTSVAQNCPITSWSWDFGDGSPPSTEQNPQHTFTNPGPEPATYAVTLTVTSDQGSDTASIDITVEAAP